MSTDKNHIVITEAQLQLRQQQRVHYEFAYLVMLGLQIYGQIKNSQGSPPGWGLVIVGFPIMLLFYLRFISVLNAMGYTWYMIIPVCAMVAVPIPGLLILIYIDRMIGRSIRAGLDEFEARRPAD